ncbi:DNA mismatch repair protein MutS [Spirosoma sp. BT702]|uniref:DNA mismatch repair protein MutS n=1 Tax=Spirosoma profusum TaxID=2771354 RepID=A0A926XXU4_9BACT|nr:DNA mismatch repair protein MutS [Spirosoma profusum]MBD2702727.1 DNA mismatch repair protein MutS [Spirosoma profusum]
MPSETFHQRQQEFTRAEQDAQRRYNQLAFWRLILFAVSALAVWLLFRADKDALGLGAALVGIIGFLVLLKKHQAVRRERDLNHQLVFINQDEASRLKRQYLRSETGEQFASPTHYYTGDLDVFGKHSLFRLLNRTHTHEGQNRLAKWLKATASPDAIHLRQLAVTDLKPQLDWRQQFEALANLEPTVGQSPEKLVQWATADVAPLSAYLNIVRFVFPAVTLGLFSAWLMGLVPGLAVLAALAIHGLVLSQVSARVKEVSEQTFDMATALGAFWNLVKQAELVKGDALRLTAIRNVLADNELPASAAIRQLANLTEGLNFRRNPYFYLFFGIASLWDIHYLFRLEGWRKTYGPALSHWFSALGELEALNSLAGFAYAHPSYVTPDIVDVPLTLDFTSAAHPLLPPERSIANSLRLQGAGKTILITGSNMSGKSTFLRTVGTNVVLALAGAVVSSEKFKCSPMRVFTSMRTQDSLEESTSSFYAELKRLQTLIKLTQQSPDEQLPVLYFLDEILKGTNSADRHRGAEALIRQLHHTTASGFVSTHDLELGQLTDADTFVRNYHFQSDLEDGQLVFDYKLRDGICKSFNASQLMQAIGIDMAGAQK